MAGMTQAQKETMLANVIAAINDILQYGQVRAMRGSQLQQASLSDLYEMRKELDAEIKAESGGGVKLLQGVPDR